MLSEKISELTFPFNGVDDPCFEMNAPPQEGRLNTCSASPPGAVVLIERQEGGGFSRQIIGSTVLICANISSSLRVKPEVHFSWILGLDFNLLPTNGFSIEPLKLNLQQGSRKQPRTVLPGIGSFGRDFL